MSILVRPAKRKLDEVDGLECNGRISQRNSYDNSIASSASQSPLPSRKSSVHSNAGSYSRKEQEVSDPNWLAPSLRESSRASPVCFDNTFHAQRTFNRNASVVLIGIRGTGKSSLAVMLAATSGRRLIDADRYFQQVTGCSRAAFKKNYELSEYRQQEAKVMESMLMEHKEGYVIACGPGSMERSGQKLLKEYSRTHPVIHVIRDPESIQSYLKAWDTDKVRRFLELSGPIYRSCSNLEFFNVSEVVEAGDHSVKEGSHTTPDLELDHRPQSATPFLTLKRLQRDFLRFVSLATSATGDANGMSNPDASFPLSMMPIKSRKYTYAVNVPISLLFEKNLDIEDLESTTDAFELKIDVAESPSFHLSAADSNLADKISQTVATIRRNTVVPFIYHVESSIPAGDAPRSKSSRRSDEAYLSLVRHGLRLAPEFLTVDLSYDDTVLSQVIASKGTTAVIGHFAAPQPLQKGWDNEEFMQMYERAKNLGCDMVRLSQPAATIDDNFAVQRFRHRINSLPAPRLPIIAYNSGPLGRMSCCFNPILTPVTQPSLTSEPQANTLPCITLREAHEALFASFTLDSMEFFVFGANVGYSLSPAMHNAAYKACGMPHHYGIYQSSSLRGLSDLVENPRFGGASVSLPYKTESIPLLHSMSPHARAIGAVNTLIPIRNVQDNVLVSQKSSLYVEKSRAGPIKALHGDNTDWIGICNCSRRGLSPANAVRPSSTGLVIGAGGMARAAVYSMIHLGLQNIFVYNRTAANAEKLVHHFNRQNLHTRGRNGPAPRPTIHVLTSLNDNWPAGYKQPTVIVSCIPTHSIGGQPAPNFQLPSQWLESPTGGVVVELAYKHLNTPVMKQIRALSHRGWVALDGLDVLPEQGFAQFELFTGRRAPRRLMRTIVLKEYKDEGEQYDPSAMQSRLQNLDGQPT